MNTEKQLALVTFEQAKQLKNAVFDWEVSDYFDNTGLLNPCIKAYSEFPAPTIALALKWFRDVKGIVSSVNSYDVDEYNYSFRESKHGRFHTTLMCAVGDRDFKTYEIAGSKLLDELLTLIENKK